MFIEKEKLERERGDKEECTYRWDCGFAVRTVRDFLSDGFSFLWEVICRRSSREEGLVEGFESEENGGLKL